MTEKEFFLQTREREYATTVKVLEHFPKEHGAFAPHERSQTAQKLFWTFVLEEKINTAVIKNDIKSFSGNDEVMPDDLDTIIARYKAVWNESQTALRALPEDSFRMQTEFFFGSMPLIDILWFMLLDSVHHRGQMSVYIRMAGGKVPSIYGPSADDPGPMADLQKQEGK